MKEIKQINVDSVNYDIVSKELSNVTYSELKALRDGGQLNEGHFYRITDYVTTTILPETKSAGNVFDVIVLATSANELSHIARAIQHEGDTYFDGNDLGAWELWYDLDNDTDKYEWADATNGKGVIYRMIDEKRNDCPYDFKNILFYNDKYTDYTTTDKYYFTFSYVVSGALYDGTVEKQVDKCYGNEMGVYINSNKKNLNRIVFRNKGFGDYCNNNTFGNYCNNNTFGYNCSSNTFGNYCNNNTFGNYCSYNTFGYGCSSNTYGDSVKNRKLNQNKTSITLNDEYYDDGSGQLVPIKHPDLSTQPSILPYKFMGQYVYEQLIPVKIGDRIVDCDFMVEHPMILSAGVFGVNSFKNIDIMATKFDALLLNTESELEGYINVKYTDCSQLLPSNGYGYGYGYEDNNTGSSILIDFGLSPDGTLYIYDPNTEVLRLNKSGEITTNSIPQNLPKKNIILGDSVTSIGYQAFEGCSGLTSITIPNSVTSIGKETFALCSGLTSIAIPNSVKSIGNLAFALCSGLTSVTIPNSVTSIGGSTFSNCSGLTSVTIGNSVTSIGDFAFYGCSGLTSVTIGNSVESIEDRAFSDCSGLTSVTIPNSVTSIGDDAFSDCSGLTSVTIPNSVTSIGWSAFEGCSGLTSVHISDIAAWCNIGFNDNPLTYAHHIYMNGEEVKDLVIPNSVTSIGEKAFNSCSGLTSVTIPNSVTSIGGSAFYNCNGLTSITCEAIIPPTIQSNTFKKVPTSIPVYVPAGSIDAYKSSQYWSNFTNIQSI